MKNIDRSKYYKEDEEGFMIYLISRLYNDLQINTALYNSISNKNNILNDNAEIYLFKILISHLKEGLKILGIMKRSPKYNKILNKWTNSNEIIDNIIKDISDELENPKNYPNTTNAKFLNIRNEVFHYCIQEPKDYTYYKNCQKNMIDAKYDVCIEIDEFEKYKYEVGVDMPLTKDVFTDESIAEVNKLKNKVVVLLKEILTDYYNKYTKN